VAFVFLRRCDVKELKEILQLSPLYEEGDVEITLKRFIESVTGVELKIIDEDVDVESVIGEVYQG